MDLSIVILHHGRPHDVTRTLQSLTEAWLPEKTEVFVVNNGEAGANEKIPFDSNLKFELRYFEIPNKGYPHGNNFGLSMAAGKHLCILTDVEVEKNTFRELTEYLRTHPGVGIVAPRLVFEDGQIQDNFRRFPRLRDIVVKRTLLVKLLKWHMRRYLMWDKDPYESEAVDWLTGAFQVFTRKCWEQIGPKDERYFLFMSDVDICRTAWEKNFEVHFVGTTQSMHKMNRLSSGGVLDLMKWSVRRHILDAIQYFWKYRKKKLPKRCPSRGL